MTHMGKGSSGSNLEVVRWLSCELQQELRTFELPLFQTFTALYSANATTPFCLKDCASCFRNLWLDRAMNSIIEEMHEVTQLSGMWGESSFGMAKLLCSAESGLSL